MSKVHSWLDKHVIRLTFICIATGIAVMVSSTYLSLFHTWMGLLGFGIMFSPVAFILATRKSE